VVSHSSINSEFKRVLRKKEEKMRGYKTIIYLNLIKMAAIATTKQTVNNPLMPITTGSLIGEFDF